MPGLVIEHLSKTLGGRLVVEDLSLRVEPGELVCLLGPSGCGKTTTLRMIGGFIPPDGGSISIDGVDVSGVPPERRPTAMVFQSYALWPHMSVFKNVAYGLKLRRLPKPEIERRVEAMLALVNLSDKGARRPAQLSGGEQQRVALARALVLEPSLLLLDEPLSNLDAKLRVGVREEIREIQQRLGIATVFVTHDQDEALAISDRVAVMSGGRIEQFDEPAALYRRPATTFVAGFIGAMSMFEGAVGSGGVRLGQAVQVPFAAPTPVAAAMGGGAAEGWTIGVRPEDVLVKPARPGGRSRATARVLKQIPHGHYRELVLGLDGLEDTRLRAFVAADAPLGDHLEVSIARALLYHEGRLAHEVCGQDRVRVDARAAVATP